MFSKLFDEILQGQVVCIGSDAWTAADKTYLGMTYHWIDSKWRLQTLLVDIHLLEGSTTGEALTEKLTDAYEKRKVARVWLHVTDCSMVKCARLLSDKFNWHGCAAHRLESSSSLVFKAKGVGDVMAKCRAITTYFNKSTQAMKRLRTACELKGIDFRTIKQDVETQWWSTYICLESLVHVKEALKLILQGDGAAAEDVEDLENCTNLTDEEWEIVDMVLAVLHPFAKAQEFLEGEQYVTVSRVIPIIASIRAGLLAILEVDRAGAAAGHSVNQRRLQFVSDLVADFNNRWGDGTRICTQMEGRRRQPRGFSHTHVLATALDPRTRNLEGIPPAEHEEFWMLVTKYLSELITNQHQQNTDPANNSSAQPVQDGGIAADDPGYDSGADTRARAQAEAREIREHFGATKMWDRPAVSPDSIAAHCVTKYRQWQNGGVIDMARDPLTGCWQHHAEADDWGQLAQLARTVLAAPATSAPVERVFSQASLIVNKRRQRLTHENVSLTLFLHNGWDHFRQYKTQASSYSPEHHSVDGAGA